MQHHNSCINHTIKHNVQSSKLFAKPEEPKRSKIWNALNPGKLWYETGREKAEMAEEKVVIAVRGGADQVPEEDDATTYTVPRDNDGNILENLVEEEEEEQEEKVDLNALVSQFL